MKKSHSLRKHESEMNIKKISLTTQIKKVIGNRILFCSVAFMIIIFGLTIYDLSNSITQLRSRINEQIKPIEDFAIDQAIINNLDTVELKIDGFNENNSTFKIEWIRKGFPVHKVISWDFPFSWVYDYQIGNIAGYQFGYFKVTGGFLSDKTLIYDLLLRLTLLGIFTGSILMILFPLAKKIPEQLFINPINRFIDLISNNSVHNEVTIRELPIELEVLEAKILCLLNTATVHERNKAAIELGHLTARVAHDIRSPIAAMEMTLHVLMQDISKEKMQMMQIAVQSVRDIANNLIEQYRGSNKQEADLFNILTASSRDDLNVARHILLYSLIEQIISQKRYEWLQKSCELTFTFMPSTKSVWINVVPGDIKRMISNLLNNAIEACEHSAKIQVELNKVDQVLELRIIDNGVGIPADKIKHFAHGESSKHVGEGLGLSGANNYMESVGGKLEITSQPNKGATVTLTFIIQPNPAWYPDQIFLSENSSVIILDDDVAMQTLWFHRLQSYPVKIYPFTNYGEAVDWINLHHDQLDKMILLIDYELSEKSVNGLMLLRHFDVKHRGYLVTSHAEEITVQKEVEEIGIYLIPKALACEIPIGLG